VDILVVYEPFLFDVEIESSLLDRAKGMEEKNKYKKSLNRMRDWKKLRIIKIWKIVWRIVMFFIKGLYKGLK
jgi:hypothetical protein